MTGPLLAALLSDGAAADRPFASHAGTVVGFARFRADVAAAAHRLGVVGCRRGLVACDDAYWATVGWFALAHVGAETVMAPNSLPATLAGLSGAFDHVVTDGAVAPGEHVLRLEAGASAPCALPSFDATKTLVTLFTSGSTGTPKRIVKTVRQFEVEAETVERVLGEAVPGGAWVHRTVAHQHLYGLTFGLCWPIATRRPFVGAAHQFWEPTLAAMAAGDVLVSSPSHLSRLGGIPPVAPDRRASAILSAGAPLPDDAAAAARAVLGCPVREFFGSTEAGVVATRLRDSEPPAAWRPLPGVSVSRLDDGRLHVSSPYILEPEGQVSEDLVELAPDGRFTLKGRGDRIAKIEGVRVSLAEFDARLGELAGVARAAVVVLGGDMPYLGAVVVLDSAGADELAALGDFRLGRRLRAGLAQHLPLAALPRRWRFVSQLPSGPLGKLRAADLAALFDAA